jgi:hypothetical protein
MKKKIIITLIIISVPVAIFALLVMLRPEGYSIISKKESSFDKKVKRIFVIAKVEERLKPVFAHSFEHSLISAFQSNGVDASVVMVKSPESDRATDHSKEAETFAPDGTMLISIKPIYRTRDNGYQAIIGTDFDVNLIDTATEKSVWHATGKVDYIRSFGPRYSAHEGIRKEFAWHTTAAIVKEFIAEVNGQKPMPIYTVTEVRQSHGQRVD